jgi:hypothetical protein
MSDESHSLRELNNNNNNLPATMKDLEGVEASSAAPERETDPSPLAVMRSTKLIRGARIAVMVVWLLSAVAMAILSYHHLTTSEYSTFQAQVRMPLPVIDRVTRI